MILHSNEIQITSKLKEDEFVVESGNLTINKELELNITVNIAKDVKGRLNIFPIINNAERLAFNSKVGSDDFNYYIPSSIGESGFLAAHLKNIYRIE